MYIDAFAATVDGFEEDASQSFRSRIWGSICAPNALSELEDFGRRAQKPWEYVRSRAEAGSSLVKDAYLITDVGSTTTKAILIGERHGEHRLLGRGEAPTTVEIPYEDVTAGVLAALRELGKKVGRDLIEDGRPRKAIPGETTKYLSTSSAGGGLQVMVFGVMKNVTADSARKAALGGGAIILDIMTTDDDRASFVKLDAIRNARPDMILISGGIDGGNRAFVLEICDLLNEANPRPRFGKDFRIPVIYAGNKDAAPLVTDTLSESFDIKVVDNIRPGFDVEALEPARTAIRELFMSHVMAQAPGYDTLRSWVDAPIMPTPAAVGKIMQDLSAAKGINVLGMDIGGATTDIFSVVDGIFHRSVSANLGMSYSAGNVLLEAGIDNIMRWLPFVASAGEVSDRICTKLIHPARIPASLSDLMIEQALATEALRLAFEQHKEVATSHAGEVSPLKATLMTYAQIATARSERRTIVDTAGIDMLVGSGGVLSHAPRRAQAALMMLNAFLPVGVTSLAVDSIFMMPHLGVLSQLQPAIALSVLEKDCFVPLGSVISLEGVLVPGEPAVSVRVLDGAGAVRKAIVNAGDIKVLPLPPTGGATVEADVMGGATLRGGRKFQCGPSVVGVIVDARGRPPALPLDPAERAALNARWASQIGAYDAAYEGG